jgi:hypothetical protein
MADEVKDAADATRIATSFLKQYYGFLRPMSAEKKNANWLVRVDVGIITKEIAEVEIVSATGKVAEYSLPEKRTLKVGRKRKG